MRYVQGIVGEAASTNSQAASLTGVVSGAQMIVGVMTSGVGTVVNSVGDGTNTYTKRSGRTFLVGAGGAEIWESPKIIGGNLTVTAALSATVACSLFFVEYAGLRAVTPFDQQASATGTSTTPSSGNVTTSQVDELLVGLCGHAGAFSAGSGFTVRLVGTQVTSEFQDRIVQAAGSYASDGTVSPLGVWTMCLATFRGRRIFT